MHYFFFFLIFFGVVILALHSVMHICMYFVQKDKVLQCHMNWSYFLVLQSPLSMDAITGIMKSCGVVGWRGREEREREREVALFLGNLVVEPSKLSIQILIASHSSLLSYYPQNQVKSCLLCHHVMLMASRHNSVIKSLTYDINVMELESYLKQNPRKFI